MLSSYSSPRPTEIFTIGVKRKLNKLLIKRKLNTTLFGAVNLSFDFDRSPKSLKIRLMSSKEAILGVKNAILRTARLIKPCNQFGNSFIKNKPEIWLFPEQRVWRGVWDLNPRGHFWPQT
jgi:hypothetical protein